MATDVPLDPATLRVLAGELDQEAEDHRARCRCVVHRLLAVEALNRAAEYRTRAIKLDLARAGEPA